MPHKDPEKRAAYQREYRKRNRARINETKRAWYSRSEKARRRANGYSVDWDRRTRHGGVVPPAEPSPCAICGDVTDLVVDHDHACCPTPTSGRKKSCGKCVRGFLCTWCNRALGMFKDDPARLIQAAIYLEENQRV